MMKKSWRDAKYINQYIPESNSFNYDERQRHFFRCQKFLCVNRISGSETCAIVFPNGKTKVGTDVWRLSNVADCCDYPYISFATKEAALQEYEFREVKRPTFIFYMESEVTA